MRKGFITTIRQRGKKGANPTIKETGAVMRLKFSCQIHDAREGEDPEHKRHALPRTGDFLVHGVLLALEESGDFLDLF